jgi:hypothetical protein
MQLTGTLAAVAALAYTIVGVSATDLHTEETAQTDA